MRQRQRLQKKLFFQFSPACDGRGSIGAGKDSHHSDHDNAYERMFDINRGARVFQFVKVVNDILNAKALDLCHESWGTAPGSR